MSYQTDTIDAEVVDAMTDVQLPALQARESDLAPLVRAAMILGQRPVDRLAKEAERAGQKAGRSGFYSFTAGKSQVEGITIDLAYTLSSIWGRMITRVEVASVNGPVIVLRGICIDLLTINSVERDYVFTLGQAPGKFADKPEQVERWRAMQIQSAASKAVRGAILGMLPGWFQDAAFEAAKAVASSALLGGASSVDDAIKAALSFWISKGFTQAELEAITGQPVALWALHELDVLHGWKSRIISGATSGMAMHQEAKRIAAKTETAAPVAAVWAAQPAAPAPEPPAEQAPKTVAQRPIAERQQKAQAQLTADDLFAAATAEFGDVAGWGHDTIDKIPRWAKTRLRERAEAKAAAEAAMRELGADDDGGEP